MARKIVVTSGKGGVGKTTVVGNLGIKLAMSGRRTLLIDMDVGLNNLDMVIGVENKAVYDLYDVATGKCRPKQTLVQSSVPNLFVICSTKRDTNCIIVKPCAVKTVISELDSAFDYILIDCPAGIDAGFYRAIECADEAVLVTTTHISSLRDADKVISVLRGKDYGEIGLVVNMVRGDLIAEGVILSPETVQDVLKIQLIGVIPADDEIFLASGGENLSGKAGKAFKTLAGNIEKRTSKVYAYLSGYKGFLGSIKRKLKRTL